MSNGFIDLSEGKVYYQVAGQGAPLVLLHAGFVDSGMWDAQWDEFCRHYTVIRFDMYGFGKSETVESPVSRRQQLYRVLEHLGVNRAILVGCSLGGETILDVALERQELVSALVLVAAAPSGFEQQGEPPRYLFEMLSALEEGDLDLASELQTRIWVDGPFRTPDQVDPQVRIKAAEMNRNVLAKGAWGFAVAPPPDPVDPPAVQRLDRIGIPTLVLAGDQDHPENLRAADLMAGSIPDMQKVILTGCAHLPNMEKPFEFNRAVLDFLNRVAL
jgi:2-hydroxy-6-oxonona-2,4-dienedioate hydrolase